MLLHVANGDPAPASSQGAAISQSPAGTFRNRTLRATSAKAMIENVTTSRPIKWSLFAIWPTLPKLSRVNVSQTPMAMLANNVIGYVTPRAA